MAGKSMKISDTLLFFVAAKRGSEQEKKLDTRKYLYYSSGGKRFLSLIACRRMCQYYQAYVKRRKKKV